TQLYCLHQLAKEVPPLRCDTLQSRKRLHGFLLVVRVNLAYRFDLSALLLLRRANQLGLASLGILTSKKSIHTDDGPRPVMLPGFIVQGLFLDTTALIPCLHGAQYAPALADALKLLVDGLLDEIGELLDDERALQWILVLVEPKLLVDDQLDGKRAPDGFFGRRGDRLVVSIRVQTVAVVIKRVERLQGRANVIELDFLCVQRTARSLDVVLQHLCARPSTVDIAQSARPDTPRDPADDGVFGIHAIGEEEREIRREIIHAHAARLVVLEQGEAVRQCERELRNGVRARLGNVISRNRHGIEVANVVVDEEL